MCRILRGVRIRTEVSALSALCRTETGGRTGDMVFFDRLADQMCIPACFKICESQLITTWILMTNI